MNHKEHRIYQYLSEPLTILGMTMDEIALGMTGIGGCLFLDSLILKSLFFGFGVGGVVVIKRVKKVISGFSLGSFLHWHFGIMKGRSPSCPESWKRFWLS
jgi:hypothetical protein